MSCFLSAALGLALSISAFLSIFLYTLSFHAAFAAHVLSCDLIISCMERCGFPRMEQRQKNSLKSATGAALASWPSYTVRLARQLSRPRLT